MHDPMVVAFEVPRPWPRLVRWGTEGARWSIARRRPPSPWWHPGGWSLRLVVAGRRLYWPPMIVIWHVEPDGRDAGQVCSQYRRVQDGVRFDHRWRWHVHHWRIQVPPAQQLRRRLLTRCAWCGGRSTKRDAVNVSGGGPRPRAAWWQGERGLHHVDCYSVSRAHATCLCPTGWAVLEHHTYGLCARCGKHRPFGMTESALVRARVLASIPHGGRNRHAYERVTLLARTERANKRPADRPTKEARQ